jgi:hypothetical protein
MRNVRRLVVAVALAIVASAGAAAGAEMLLDEPAGSLATSAAPSLLGPITERGRTGWDCAPEHAATARTAATAGLPHG